MKDFKILLIAPVLNAGIIMEDIGICYIAAVLRQNGYNVRLISFMEKDVNYEEIIDFQPDMVGLSTYNQTLGIVYEICKKVKKELPGAYTCIGGSSATFYAKEILEEASFIDYAILGEGETAFLELAERLRHKAGIKDIKGLAYRNDGMIVMNDRRELIQNLDELPFPCRDILAGNNLRFAMVSGSRGCTNNCYFCSSHNFWKSNGTFQWRGRSPKSVVDELEYMHNELKVKQFWFTDPSFEDPGFNEQRIRGIAEEIIKRNLKISYIVYFRATFYKKAGDELMELLVKSGLQSVYMGAESMNSSDLAVYGKKATMEDNINSIAFFKKYNINVEIGFINFNPYSTFQGLRENAAFLEKYGYNSGAHHISRVMIFKGSKLYERVKADGLLKQGRFNDLYGYTYVDRRIGVLADFLAEYFEALEQQTHFFEQLSLLTDVHHARLANFKRHFCREPGSEVYRTIAAHEERFGGITAEFNKQVGMWFNEMLDLAENGWDCCIARELSGHTYSKDNLQRALALLTNEKMKLLRELARLDRNYMLYL